MYRGCFGADKKEGGGIKIVSVDIGKMEDFDSYIVKKGNSFYFIDEVWELRGPYETKDEAMEHLQRYIELLEEEGGN